MIDQGVLFDFQIPKTQGIKYAGSKLKILPEILKLVEKTGVNTVFDGFSGSTRVSQALAKQGCYVHSNDISHWSPVFAMAYLKNIQSPKEYESIIEHLNSLKPVDGWFTEHYGGEVTSNPEGNAIQSDGSKKPWQLKNTKKLDAIRIEIDNLNLDEITKSVVLTSLILGLDKVESTLGHFSSYLKTWSPRSYDDLQLEVPMLWINKKENKVTCSDVFDVLSEVNCDLAYFDPPYGSNNEKMPPSRVRYASYYHIWTTVIKNDKPTLFGKVSRRKDTADTVSGSIFEEFRKSKSDRFIAVEAIEKLIKNTPCEWIILSYSSGGRATERELNEVIRDNGELIKTIEIDHQKNVMASMKWTNDWTKEIEVPNQEFLFLVKGK